jgi:polysaccharide biosynthesis protein VpsQ
MSGPRFRLRWAVTAAWVLLCLFIIYLADHGLLRPIYKFVGVHPGSDKIGHFVLIGASAGLLNLALGLRTVRFFGRGWLLGSVLIAIFCTLEEISQHWLPARSFDLLDLAGDYAGILFFGWLARFISKRRTQS